MRWPKSTVVTEAAPVSRAEYVAMAPLGTVALCA